MKTPLSNTYTKKQVFIAILPWSIIVVIVLLSAGAAIGWFSRSNFEDEVRNQVSISMKEVKNGSK